MNADLVAAQQQAVALLAAAAGNSPACAELAVGAAFERADRRVLVAFILVESIWSWAPPDADSDHPLLGPLLTELRAGDDARVRDLLTRALTQKAPGSYAALFVQLAFAAATLVPDLGTRLPVLGLLAAADPAGVAGRAAGPE